MGVTHSGPALFAQASLATNKTLRSGVSILPMHKGVKERVMAERRPKKVYIRAYLNSNPDNEGADHIYDALEVMWQHPIIECHAL